MIPSVAVDAGLKLEFCPGLNVLIGENGTGKTRALSLTKSQNPGCLYSQMALVQTLGKTNLLDHMLFKVPCAILDLPETGLGPKLQRSVAKSLILACQAGTQVILTTHSLFLMRELDILTRTEFPNLTTRFFGFYRTEGITTVRQGNTIDDIGNITALDEELAQADRYLASSHN